MRIRQKRGRIRDLDAFTWAASGTYRLLGVPVRVRSEKASIIETLDELLARFKTSAETRVRPSRVLSVTINEEGRPEMLGLYRDSRRIAGTPQEAVAVSQLLAEANRLAVEAYPLFAAHSGVVASEGRAVAFPAATEAGKSTLVAACVLQGFGYVSDEALCADLEEGVIEPYPKPLGLSPESLALLGLPPASPPWDQTTESAVLVESLGGRVAEGPLGLSDVVLAEFGHEEATLDRVAPSEVMAILLKMSFNNYKHPEASFRLAARLAARACGWRLRYGNPIEAAVLLRRRLPT